ncbi:hypothetical protein [Mycobacterium leprae]|uniref:hypothetical protein n=1 Tax=Mycobacterium leprae TaxID=1769 RepID=UPI001E3F14DA|nr:hypothetical protein [Mycobacterium leprae]
MLEIADGIHPSGQTVDLHGAVTSVVERMSLTDGMCKRNLDQRNITSITTDRRRRSEIPVEVFCGNRHSQQT